MDALIRGGYDDGHRAFLQALLSHGALTFEDAQGILAAILSAKRGGGDVRPEQVTQKDFQSYLEVASDAASLFDYEVRSAVHQVSKQRIYALVNTASDAQTQLATTYSAEELAFIKRTLDGIFNKYNSPRMEVLAVTEMQAIKFARPPSGRGQDRADGDDEAEQQQTQTAADRGLKHSEVENVLASLVEGGWLEKSRAGFYSVTPRGLLELRPWLVETYNEADAAADEWQRIKFCEACRDIVTFGLRCSRPSCTLRLHDMCQEAFLRARRTTNCPKCSQPWTGDAYVGERAVTMTEAYQRGRRRTGGGGRRATLADDVMRQEEQEEREQAEQGGPEGQGDRPTTAAGES